MKIFRVLAIPTVAVVLATVGGATFIVQGAFDISARSPHWGITTTFLEVVRDRSISARAADITPPSGFDERPRLIEGIVHYRAHCAVCHGAPGVEPEEIAAGMYPQPPALHQKAGRPAAEVFWIIKNGIKMSGMPAWGGDHGDEDLWPVVALATRLPGMNPTEYAALSAEADRLTGAHHDHASAAPLEPASTGMAANPVAQSDGGHGHSHTHSHADHKH